MKLNIKLTLPILIYLLITILIAMYISKKDKIKDGFINNYFLANRSLGSFVLAMTLVSTYIGASSFIGGPAIAYNVGLSWVLLACIQIPVVFLILGVLGKKLGYLSRKINAVTVMDILKARYKNKKLILLLSILMLIFLLASIIAQFIGGARIFESILNIPYFYSLLIFSLMVVFYTSIGGFKAVTFTDALQGLIMTLATSILFIVILIKAGGMYNIMQNIKEINPNLLTPTSGGNISIPYLMSFWVLVGVALLGLPATTVRCMAYKDSKSLHKAMLIGTFFVGFLILSMHLVGFMGRSLIPNIEIADKLIPTLALTNLNPILAGVFIGGPLAAIMSSVDSLLILVASTIIKDIYVSYIDKKSSEKKLKKLTLFISIMIGFIVFLLSIKPLSLIVYVNLFALSGQEVLFFLPVCLGLFWKKANDKGAIFSIISGFILFIYLEISKKNVLGLHNIVPCLFVSIIVFIIVSLLTYKEIDKEIEKIFFN